MVAMVLKGYKNTPMVSQINNGVSDSVLKVTFSKDINDEIRTP